MTTALVTAEHNASHVLNLRNRLRRAFRARWLELEIASPVG
jgi:hypothetical protein